jgi:hypothetical protein
MNNHHHLKLAPCRFTNEGLLESREKPVRNHPAKFAKSDISDILPIEKDKAELILGNATPDILLRINLS